MFATFKRCLLILCPPFCILTEDLQGRNQSVFHCSVSSHALNKGFKTSFKLFCSCSTRECLVFVFFPLICWTFSSRASTFFSFLPSDTASWCSLLERKEAPPWNCSQQGVWIILSNQVMISAKRHNCWGFQMYFRGTLRTTSRVQTSSFVFERRQMYLWLISPG